MKRIHLLADEVAEKIAAGEVIERPASVVKELVENAVDAGAGRITIELVEGGARLIQVTDDGEGMTPEDLPLAFQRHATSKLTTTDDLWSVRTLGFRGEALPSIAAVAHVQAVTATADSIAGAAVEVVGGRIGPVRESAAAPGTTVVVRDLFFNVPARKKFLKKQTTELGRITDFVQRLALAYPEIAFELNHNQRPVFVLPAVTDLRERIARFFGRELAGQLIDVSGDDGYLRLRAYLADRHYTRTNARSIHLYLNRRFIRDKVLTAAVMGAYRGLIESRRYPVAFLFLEIDPSEVDVNVHPTKLEVRLRNEARVFTTVHELLRTRLEEKMSGTGAELADLATLDDRRERIRQKIGEFFLRSDSQRRQPDLWKDRAESGHPAGSSFATPPAPRPAPRVHMLAARSVMQIHNSFILEETDEGFALTDQHALHERILYEETMTKLRAQALASQRLLTPVIIEADAAEMLAAGEHNELLRKAGLEVNETGPGILAVQSVPQLLHRDDPGRLLRDMLDALTDESDQAPEDPLERVAQVIACRGAVKAGEPLTSQEMESLLVRRDQSPRSATCPHGRPTTMFFSLSELAGRFGRS